MSLDLEPIKARSDAATPGPWGVAPWHDETVMAQVWLDWDTAIPTGNRPDNAPGTSITSTPSDAEFIAHAREDVPALVAEVERLRSSLDRVRALEPTRVYGGGTSSTKIWLTVNQVRDALHEPEPPDSSKDVNA